jgi:hypothetical protein
MKRLAFIVAVAVGATVLAAVVFASHGGSAQAAVRRAAAQTLEAGSSRFTITYSYTGPGLFGSFAAASEFAAHGAMDYRSHRGFIRYDGLRGWDQQIVYDGDVTYMSLGAAAGWMPKGKWLRAEGGQDDPFDPQARALRDPAALLSFLRLTSSEVRDAGAETIGGVETTRYDGTLDFQRIVDQAPPAQRSDLQDELDFIREGMPSTTVGYSAWVDSSGTTRRLRIDEAESATLTVDFHDFGTPVEVDIPPADAILTDAEFEKLIESHVGAQGVQECKTEKGDDGGSTQLCTATVTMTFEKVGP